MSRLRPKMNAAEHRHRRSGDGMLDIILHEMEGLSPGEKRGPIDATKAAAARELAHAAGDAAPDACPWCGSSPFIRKGHDRDGSQRRPCRGAGAPSRPRAGACPPPPSPMPRPGPPFAEPALSGRSLGECARACHVCLRASRLCRMRPCEAMERSLLPFRTGPSVSWQVGGTHLDESPTGSRARGAAGMPARAPCPRHRRARSGQDGPAGGRQKTETSSFRKTPPGQCSCLVSFIRSRSLRRSSS